jgi:hypothetical protein
MTRPDSMQWPTWREKLMPISMHRWPAYNGFRVGFRDWYFGPWLRISLGWWGIQIGGGTYEGEAS